MPPVDVPEEVMARHATKLVFPITDDFMSIIAALPT
jgi:hypothetical protein